MSAFDFSTQLTIGPGVDRPAALKIDVRAKDAAQLCRSAVCLWPAGIPAPLESTKNCSSWARSARAVAA